MSHLENKAIQSAVWETTKVANHLQFIEKELYALYCKTKNPIAKTFAEAVFDFLKPLKAYFSGLLGQLSEFTEPTAAKITLLSLTSLISQKSLTLQFIIRCLNVCSIEDGAHPEAVRLLNKLWEIEQ